MRFGVVVIGAEDIGRAELFWTQALGYQLRGTQLGGDWRELAPKSGEGTVIGLQRSEALPRHDPRLHIDLHVDSDLEQEAEIARLIALGAERVTWEHYPADPDFVVLADTEGNRFCVVNTSHGT